MRSIRSAAKKISSSESSRKNTAGRKQRPKTRSTRSLPNTRRSTRWPDRYEKRLSPIIQVAKGEYDVDRSLWLESLRYRDSDRLRVKERSSLAETGYRPRGCRYLTNTKD